jgi:hypothetical protein
MKSSPMRDVQIPSPVPGEGQGEGLGKLRNAHQSQFIAPVLVLFAIASPRLAQAQSDWKFHLQEATISEVQRAIQEQQITCKGLVQAYLNRAKAFNGVATQYAGQFIAVTAIVAVRL